MDRALWITWYDLPSAQTDACVAWTHEQYIPWVLQHTGCLWAAHYKVVDRSKRPVSSREKNLVHHVVDPSVPRGAEYVLLFGAEHAGVFGAATPDALHAKLASAGREQLALRVGERTNIMVESERVEGPEGNAYAAGTLLAPCIQLGTYGSAWQDEQDILGWYTQWRLAAMGVTPGVIRTRRMASVAGWAKHGVLYEFVSLDARNQHFMAHEDHRPDMKAWSDRMVPKLQHAPGSPSLGCRIWPPQP